jgi:hypothetical protein
LDEPATGVVRHRVQEIDSARAMAWAQPPLPRWTAVGLAQCAILKPNSTECVRKKEQIRALARRSLPGKAEPRVGRAQPQLMNHQWAHRRGALHLSLIDFFTAVGRIQNKKSDRCFLFYFYFYFLKRRIQQLGEYRIKGEKIEKEK